MPKSLCMLHLQHTMNKTRDHSEIAMVIVPRLLRYTTWSESYYTF